MDLDKKLIIGRWEGIVFARDPEVFPTYDEQLFGAAMKRMKIDKKPEERSLVPEDAKALRREIKSQMKHKK